MLQRFTPVSLLFCLIALTSGCKDTPSSGADNTTTPDPTVPAFTGVCGMRVSELTIDTLELTNMEVFNSTAMIGRVDRNTNHKTNRFRLEVEMRSAERIISTITGMSYLYVNVFFNLPRTESKIYQFDSVDINNGMEFVISEYLKGEPQVYTAIRGTIRIDSLGSYGLQHAGRGSWSGIFRGPGGKLVAANGRFDSPCP